MSAAQIGRAILLALAAARATRFFTSDTLGEWVAVGPAKRWAFRHEAPVAFIGIDDDPMPTPDARWGWRSKLTKGLDCPFCVGFWLGALLLIGEVTLGRLPVVRHLWNLGVAAFALNYVAGHLSAKMDG